MQQSPMGRQDLTFDDYHYACLDAAERILNDARETGNAVIVDRLQKILSLVHNSGWFISYLDPLFLDGELVGAEAWGYQSRELFYSEYDVGNVVFDPDAGGYKHTGNTGSFQGRLVCDGLTEEQMRDVGRIPAPNGPFVAMRISAIMSTYQK